MKHSFIIKGDIVYTKDVKTLVTGKNHYLICVDGKSAGIFSEIPEDFEDLPVIDHTGKMVIPGLIDLHVHAPQYSYRGMGMDKELIDWLDTYAFPEESKFCDLAYAKEAYDYFVEGLYKSATTRASIFGTIHREATELLMAKLHECGMAAYVGKVNMDRNSPETLCEKDAVSETKEWIEETQDRYKNIKPILTPRFTPSCTDDLMMALGEIRKTYQLPMQSHLSENPGEVAWVKELCPWSECYGDTYAKPGMFGGDCPTIMAHCVYSGEKEINMMKAQGVYIAHCPQSNMNIASGIAPVRKYLEKGLKVGLGSDVAGGSHLSIFRAMTDAIQVSKLYWRLVDKEAKPLNVIEAFYMAAKGGGEFFGRVGSFEEGYAFDAVIIDDESIKHPQPLTLEERLERMVYLSDDRQIISKYVDGHKLF